MSMFLHTTYLLLTLTSSNNDWQHVFWCQKEVGEKVNKLNKFFISDNT